MKKIYNLYLDDERDPKLIHKNWIVVRSFQEFKEVIQKNGLPVEISLDNDLGMKNGKLLPTGYDCVKWMIYTQRYDLRNIVINVHSANGVAKKDIELLIKNWNYFLNNVQ